VEPPLDFTPRHPLHKILPSTCGFRGCKMNEGIFDSGKWDRARVQVIEATQRVPVMAGATHVSMLLLGGGGGGGSGKLDLTLQTANAGAGGSGAGLQYRRRMPLRLMQLMKMLAFDVVIGAGGTAGAAQTTTNNGNPGGTGGSSRIEFQFLHRGPTQSGQNTVRLNVSGGGLGAGGTASFANATATANNSGQINGITGGQGSSLAQQGGHSGNSFGTNPWHWIAVSGGISGNGAGFNAQNTNPGLHTFYSSGLSSASQAGNDNGLDASNWAKPVWDFVLADWKTAPVMEELAWLTTVSGGGGGNSASSGAGGAGGKGYRGSGGGGGAGAHSTASGAGGTGGNGVAVFWWERL